MTYNAQGYKLFLDDERYPEQVTWVQLPTNFRNHYKIVRSYDEFVRCIERRGLPEFVTFDHDLAMEHYREGFAGAAPKYEEYKEKTGYHCAEWLVHYCVMNDLQIPPFQVHSMSPVGRDNIRRVLDAANVARMREQLKNI